MARKSRKIVAPDMQEEAMPIFRVGAYIRLSAVDRKNKGDSIENQQSIISTFIAERDDLELIDTYIDNGLSGQTLDRPAFQRMLADMERGRINCCITKDLSRLGRSAIDTGYYIEKYFPTHNIRFIAINDLYDSADGSSGGIVVSLKNMVNEAYALDIGRKIRAPKQMNIQNGCFIGRFPPYGYMKSKTDKHKLVPDEYAAPIVRRMFEMVANGEGVSSIAEWLRANDILPPKRYYHSIGLASEAESSGSLHWSKSAIYALLKNRVYVGDMVQGKFKTKSYVQTKLPQSEWVITENTHEPIVSRELFHQVQRMWADSSYQGRTLDELRMVNPLLRKVFCGHCGRTMFRCNGKKEHSFICNTRQMYSVDDCVPNRIPESVLKSVLLEALRAQIALIDRASALDTPQRDNAELREAQSELHRNSRFLKGLYESLICGDITDSDYKDMKLSYEMKIASLIERIKKLRESARLTAFDALMQGKAADRIGAIHGIADLTADAVDILVDRILVFENKRIELHFKFTDEIVKVGGARV